MPTGANATIRFDGTYSYEPRTYRNITVRQRFSVTPASATSSSAGSTAREGHPHGRPRSALQRGHVALASNPRRTGRFRQMSVETDSSAPHTPPHWRPLEAVERRVLGVLIEKAKTTPENYPLSLNALRAGANQKNNRSPLMQLEEAQIEDALEKLRKAGVVSQVQGSGRVDRYRHLAYEWLGVEKVELAVMAELLLRGSQTVGELRGARPGWSRSRICTNCNRHSTHWRKRG